MTCPAAATTSPWSRWAAARWAGPRTTTPTSPATAAWSSQGYKSPLKGAYLRTVDGAPLNSATFKGGYTIEAFYRLPADWDPDHNAWSGLVSRTGTGGAAGKTGDDPDEPLATLSLSNDREPQWAMRPLNQEGIATNWGQETPLETWWHLALVNDGKHTTLYVQGCPVVRNPKASAVGHHLGRTAVAARRLRVRRQDRPDPPRPARRRPDRRTGAARLLLHDSLTLP